jgi:hypothetical protein
VPQITLVGATNRALTFRQAQNEDLDHEPGPGLTAGRSIIQHQMFGNS